MKAKQQQDCFESDHQEFAKQAYLLDLSKQAHFSPLEEVVQLIQTGPAKRFRIEQINSCGQSGSVYDQDEAEWVCLVAGRAVLEVEGLGRLNLVPGQLLYLPPHCRHKLIDTSERCIWLCFFLTL